MALYKDGNIYRTYDEQVDHLTEAHREQITINENVQQRLNELGVGMSVGGQNLVRFAFEKQGTFYKIANNVLNVELVGQKGDYFEIRSGNKNDIPAYGYYTNTNVVVVSWFGDFTQNYEQLTFRNVTTQQEWVMSVTLTAFTGTSLNDYNADNAPNQVFNVIDDLAYNAPTQYASFDLNRDGKYNFVYLGINPKGQDGRSVYTTNNAIISGIVALCEVGDSVMFGEDNTTQYINANAKAGDLYQYNGNGVWIKTGSVRGEKGEQGEQGIQGIQGIPGQKGAQGATGEKGAKGDKGDPGNQGLTIYTGTYTSVSQLPAFSSTKVGDAYRVQNTSLGYVTYDLYFHAEGGTTWDVQANWGGIKGDKGDKGDQGEQGLQGVQGPQGPTGATGPQGPTGPAGKDGTNATQMYLHDMYLTMTGCNPTAAALPSMTIYLRVKILTPSKVAITASNFWSSVSAVGNGSIIMMNSMFKSEDDLGFGFFTNGSLSIPNKTIYSYSLFMFQEDSETGGINLSEFSAGPETISVKTPTYVYDYVTDNKI